MTAYARDVFFYPVTLDSTNWRLKIIEDPTGVPNTITLVLDPGQWWFHDDTSFHASKPGLLYAIKTLLNAGTTVGLGTRTGTPTKTYSWTATTPTSSTGIASAGLTLKATGSAGTFQIDYDGLSPTTMDGRWFGAATANPGDLNSVAGVGLDQAIASAYCSRGRFITHDLADGHAINKRRIPYKLVRRSGENAEDSITLVWQQGYRRIFRYEDVPGALVFTERSAESEYASVPGLSTSDQNHAWELLWNSLSDGDEVIVVHNAHTDLQIDTHDHEVVKLHSGSDWDSFALAKQSGGDLHDIDFVAWVREAQSSYAH